MLMFSHNIGDSEDTKRVDKLFVDGQFDPLDSHLPPLDELLKIPLQKELLKKNLKAHTCMMNFGICTQNFKI